MSAWIALKDRQPPRYASVVFGWWCYWPDSMSWEISDDQPDCATHWCELPKEPPYDRAALARVRGEAG